VAIHIRGWNRFMASWVDVQPNARRAGNNPEERSDEKQTID
jgi:hypothetical protein